MSHSLMVLTNLLKGYFFSPFYRNWWEITIVSYLRTTAEEKHKFDESNFMIYQSISMLGGVPIPTACNVFGLRTDNKGWPSSLGVGHAVNNHSP
jgi:hypothetical protein